jgi:Leucine-rich repeat (LRR) protein/ankyrin repeat protein
VSEQYDAVKYLLSRSTNQPLHNLNTFDTPLLVACQKKNYKIAQLLLNHSPQLLLLQDAHNQHSALHIACSNRDVEMLDLLLVYVKYNLRYSNINESDKFSLDFLDVLNRTPLFNACYSSFLEGVRRLLEFNSQHRSLVSLDVNAAVERTRRTPLHCAVQKGEIEIIQLLLNTKGIDTSLKALPAKDAQEQLLRCSNIQKKLHAVQEYMDYGLSTSNPTSERVPGENNAFAIYETQRGRLQILPKGSKGTIFDDIYMTVLAEACVYGRVNVVGLLLKHGARDEDGFACQICHIVQNASLEQLILSYHCSLGVIKTDHRRKQAHAGGKLPHGLELHWSSKKLSVCNGEWLNNQVSFYLEQNRIENDIADTYTVSTYGTKQHCDYHGYNAPIGRVPVLAKVDYSAVKAVNLDHNFLNEVPIELFRLPKVIKIDLSHNHIIKLPEEDHYKSLESRALCGWECKDLEELNLSHNCLTELPSCVWVLPNLETLYGQKNSISMLFPHDKESSFCFSLSTSMTKIDFSENELEVIPPFVFELPNLKTVQFQHNMLQSIPKTVWTCESLKDLDMSHNNISKLSWGEEERTMNDTQQESGPEALIKRSNKITGGRCQVQMHLQSKPSFQRYPSVADAIEPLPNSELSCNINAPINAVEGFDYSSLTRLVLSHNQFRTFPEALPCLAPNLEELDISENEFQYVDIQFIPQWIKKFTARYCKISRFGNVLQKDMWLQVVKNCQQNKTFGMQCQHRSHHNLPYLMKLDLLDNDLKHFQLIHHPPLKSKHEDPGKEEECYRRGVASLDLLYPLLEALDLGKNKLEGQFNPNIGYQSHLKSINLSKNHGLEKLPMEFAHLKNSRHFTGLARNDCPNLVEPPKEYQNVSLTHLLAYMRSRLKE